MAAPFPSVAVVGAGPIALATADAFLDDGWAVEVIYNRPLLAGSAAVAAGLGEPMTIEDPRTVRWFAASYRRWLWLGDHASEAGIDRRSAKVYSFRSNERIVPNWATAVDELDEIPTEELPKGYEEGWGYTYSTFVVTPDVTLAWLSGRLSERRARFTTQTVLGVEELIGRASVVVNATGMASRTLFGDSEVTIDRDDLLVYPKPEHFSAVLCDRSLGSFVVAHRHRVIAGAGYLTLEGEGLGWDDPSHFSAWDGTGGRADTWSLVASRSRRLLPELAGMPILAIHTCVQPQRPRVRVDYELIEGRQLLLHAVGAGRSSWSLAWGIALDAVDLADQLVGRSRVVV